MSKFYAVKRGRSPGIYLTWAECELQVKGFQNAKFKSFNSLLEAETYINDVEELQHELPIHGLAVDASLLKGSKGEFQIVDLSTGKLIYSSPVYVDTTVNVMEFLAIIKAIEISRTQIEFTKCDIYSDSATAITWVKNKHINSKLELTEELKLLVDNALIVLNQNCENKIIKWDTNSFGEIPADFSRK